MAEPLDLEALLNRWRVASRQTALPDDVRRDVAETLAALERIPELERRVQDKNFELTGVHEALRKATQERDAAIATVDAVTQRAEQVEAAARRMERWRDQAWRLGALGTQDIEALMSALAPASEGSDG